MHRSHSQSFVALALTLVALGCARPGAELDPADEADVLAVANGESVDRLVAEGGLDRAEAEALVALRPIRDVALLADVAPAPPAADAADAERDAVCEFYRARYEYWQSLALSCASSPCYPYAGWYAYWAGYYHSLIVAFCDVYA